MTVTFSSSSNNWRAGNRLNAEPEKWDFAGGTVEKGELPADAFIREVFEETDSNVIINAEEHSAFEWVNTHEIKEKDYDFVRYVVPVIDRILID